jgi:hypothetical protein
MEDLGGYKTAEQIAAEIGAGYDKTIKAIKKLRIRGERRNIRDQRLIYYPPGTGDRIRTWLLERS